MKPFLPTITHPFQDLFSKRWVRVSIGASLFVLLMEMGLIWWKLFPEIQAQAHVPLHYNIHFGVDYFGAWWKIFTIPLVGFVVFVVNTIAAVVAYKKDMVLSMFFLGTMVLVEVLLCIALVFVVILNLSYYG